MYAKLEIPIDFQTQTEGRGGEGNQPTRVSYCSVVPDSGNSTCMVEFGFMCGTDHEVKLIAALQGPTEAKFGSKQDAVRTTIEVNIKCQNSLLSEYTNSCLVQPRSIHKLRQDLKQTLEQVV